MKSDMKGRGGPMMKNMPMKGMGGSKSMPMDGPMTGPNCDHMVVTNKKEQ